MAQEGKTAAKGAAKAGPSEGTKALEKRKAKPAAVAAPPAAPSAVPPAEKPSAAHAGKAKTLVYDADHAVLGRAATRIAKKLLEDLEVEVIVVNAEKAVITGSPVFTVAKFKARRARGKERKGPFYPRRADRIFKRAVRGMLPYQQEKGRQALKRLRCYHGVPKRYAGKGGKIEGAHELRTPKFLTLQQLSEAIAG